MSSPHLSIWYNLPSTVHRILHCPDLANALSVPWSVAWRKGKHCCIWLTDHSSLATSVLWWHMQREPIISVCCRSLWNSLHMLRGHLIVCICQEWEETGLLSGQNNSCNFELSSSCVPLAYAAKWFLYLSLDILNYRRNTGLRIGCSPVILMPPFKYFI